MSEVEVTTLTHRPVTFIRVFRTVDPRAELVVEVDVLATVVQEAGPIPDNVRHTGVLRGEGIGVRGDDEVTAGRNGNIREGELNAGGQSPAVQVHSGSALVVQLDVFLQHIL